MADVALRATARTPRASLTSGLDLQAIKDDLGICGVENDAWLERRIAGVWARFEKYTARYLCFPPAQFVDDWSRLGSAQHNPNQPPALATGPVGSPFLRVCPVVSIDALRRDGQDIAPTEVRFEPATGKLFSLSASSWHGGHDVSGELAQGLVTITYTAGWDDIPPDLYEALLGALGTLWNQRVGQSGGMSGGNVSSINVVDVGTVEMGSADNSYVTAAMKGGTAGGDPLVGPWAYLLQEYIDYRVQIGSPLIPVTELIGPAP